MGGWYREPPLVNFKKGKIQFKSGGKSYAIPLGSVELYICFCSSIETVFMGGSPLFCRERRSPLFS
jgi:hypothetical protein